MYKDALEPDDAEFLDGLFAGTSPTATLSDRRDTVIEELKALDRSSHADRSRVGRILWWALRVALQGRFYKIEHGPRVAYVTPDRQGTVPKRYAHKPIDPRTGEANGYVQAVMVDLAWPDFNRDRLRFKERWLAMGRNVDVLDRIAELESDYPETKTPREAMVLAGMDPDALLKFAV